MSELIAVIYAVGALLSALAAFLAWAARLWWGKEFAAAKDETIHAKEAQIAVLKEQFDATVKAKDAQLESYKELTPVRVLSSGVSSSSASG